MKKVGQRGRAVYLRKQGVSYRKISRELNIARSTVIFWTRHIRLSKTQERRLLRDGVKMSTEAVMRSAQERRRKWKKEALGKWELYKSDPLFCVGLALYWGEGSKTIKSAFAVTNSDAHLLKVWVSWCNKYAPDLPIKLWLNIHHKEQVRKAVKHWKRALNLDAKVSVTIAKTKPNAKRTLPYGTLRVDGGVGATKYRFEMMVWLERLSQYFK